jgi:mRNA interferase RelE/StbE
LACKIKLSDAALKYLQKLDRTTAKRIVSKVQDISKDPYNFRLSKPLRSNEKRSARIGDYRILFVVEKDLLLVADIGPRGRVYRDA